MATVTVQVLDAKTRQPVWYPSCTLLFPSGYGHASTGGTDGIIVLDHVDPSTYTLRVFALGYQDDVTTPTITETVTIQVLLEKPTTCTPKWVCEQPLNGYENDGCGNRRASAACNPAPPPPPPPPQSYGTGYCTVSSYVSMSATLWKYFHPDIGTINDGYTSQSDAEYHASLDTKCFVAPTGTVVPNPLDLTQMQNNITQNDDENTDLLSGLTGGLSVGISTIENIVAGMVGTLNGVYTAVITTIPATLTTIYTFLTGLPKTISDGMADIRSSLVSISAWTTGFWDGLGSFFSTKYWADNLITPLIGQIDVWASWFLDINATNPLWDELQKKFQGISLQNWTTVIITPVLQGTQKWFSDLVGIDPAVGFWGSITKNVVGITTAAAEQIISALLPPPDYWEKNKKW